LAKKVNALSPKTGKAFSEQKSGSPVKLSGAHFLTNSIYSLFKKSGRRYNKKTHQKMGLFNLLS